MASMDKNTKSVDCSPPKEDVFVDANEEANPISNARNVSNVQNHTIDRIKNYTIRQTMYDFFFWYQVWSLLFFSRKSYCWSILNLSTKPAFVLPMITSIAMTIGILVVCFTAPKLPGMSFLFYILHIQHDKSSQLIQFCFISIVSFVLMKVKLW